MTRELVTGHLVRVALEDIHLFDLVPVGVIDLKLIEARNREIFLEQLVDAAPLISALQKSPYPYVALS